MTELIQLRHNVIGTNEADKIMELIFLTHEMEYEMKFNKDDKVEIVKKNKCKTHRFMASYDALVSVMLEIGALIEQEFPEQYKKAFEKSKTQTNLEL